MAYTPRSPVPWSPELTALDTLIAAAVSAGRGDDFDVLRLHQVREQLASTGAQYDALWTQSLRRIRQNEQYVASRFNAWEAKLAAAAGPFVRADLVARHLESLQLEAQDRRRRFFLAQGVDTLLLPELESPRLPLRLDPLVVPPGPAAAAPAGNGVRVLYATMHVTTAVATQTTIDLSFPATAGTLVVTRDGTELVELVDHSGAGTTVTLATPCAGGEVFLVGKRGTEVCRVETRLRGLLGSRVDVGLAPVAPGARLRWALQARIGPYTEQLGEVEVNAVTGAMTQVNCANSALIARVVPLGIGRPADLQYIAAPSNNPIAGWLPMVGAQGLVFEALLERLTFAAGYPSCPTALKSVADGARDAVQRLKDESPRISMPPELGALEQRLQIALRGSRDARAYLGWVAPTWP